MPNIQYAQTVLKREAQGKNLHEGQGGLSELSPLRSDGS
jgi:hypothetical protein